MGASRELLEDSIKSISPTKSGLMFGIFKNIAGTGWDVHLSWAKEPGYLGGMGITDRPISEINEQLPGILERINKEKGKIAVFGEGVSMMAPYLANLYKDGLLREPPIIADIFDYRLLCQDLLALKVALEHRNIGFPKNLRHTLLTAQAIKSGNLHPIQYGFGSRNVPQALLDTDLALNCHGPPVATLNEQLSTLSYGGELYVVMQHYNGETLPHLESSKYKVTENSPPIKGPGYIIQKLFA